MGAEGADRVAARKLELSRRVAETLPSGERPVCAAWVARMPGVRTGVEVMAQVLHPGRLIAAETVEWMLDLPFDLDFGPEYGWYTETRRGVLGGPPESLAGSLDRTLPDSEVTVVLAVTEDRVALLRKLPAADARPGTPAPPRDPLSRRLVGGVVRFLRNDPPPQRPIPPLEVVWHAARTSVVDAGVREATISTRLGLRFADGSWLVLVAPLAGDVAAALSRGTR
jgi:hypothetical protein